MGTEIPFSKPIDFPDREIAITELIQKTIPYKSDNEQSFVPAESSASWLELFIKLVYFSGFFVFLTRFLLGLFRLSQQVRQSHKILFDDHKIVLIRNNSDPYCFFNNIFIREEDYNSVENDIQLIKHELVHVKQYHSVDIVIIELVKVLFWFNPVFILFDRAIRINHEYLADRDVVEKTVDAGTYAERLLKFVSDKSQISFTSGASYKFIQKRIRMLFSDSGSSYPGLKSSGMLVMVLLFFAFLTLKISGNTKPNEDRLFPEKAINQIRYVGDIDGNYYKVIRVGNMLWMSENLRTTKYNDGKEIKLSQLDSDWMKYEPAFCWYNNERTDKSERYGALYNWYAVNTGKLCPAGWHVPDGEELSKLVIFKSGDTLSGGMLKETGTRYWKDPNRGATNESGFTGLPAGGRHYSGKFISEGEKGYWWTLKEENEYVALCLTLSYDTPVARPWWSSKRTGLSVRCVRNIPVSDSLLSRSGLDSHNSGLTMNGFSGIWKLNPERSISMVDLTGFKKIITIDHSGNNLSVKSKTKLSGIDTLKWEQIYSLDGKEMKIKNGDRTSVVKAILADGSKSILIEERVVFIYEGEVREVSGMQKYELEDNGHILKVTRKSPEQDFWPIPKDERIEVFCYERVLTK